MADAAPVVHIGENSPEEVAFKLLQTVADTEGKRLRNSIAGQANADRKWLLDTYAECLEAVNGARSSGSIWAKLAE